ncbi:MAG: serine hydroxymethyltransferase [Candidatus Aenigmatarchaeota archaeon]
MDKEKIINLVNKQEKWRREECINLIASESVLSPLAEKYYVSDFEGRYNEHDKETHYQGVKYSLEIEEICNQLFRERFDTPFVDVRPISGAIANLIVFSSFLKPGDLLMSLGIQNGAHISSSRWGAAGIRGVKDIGMFFDFDKMNIDVEKTVELIKKVEPKLIVFGGSMILFPEPVKEIVEQIDEKIRIVYDAAHVFGLIYNKEFQKPLEEGAHVITSSTHKTFQGPQGGIIIGSRNLDEEWEKIQKTIFPGLLSNTHIHRFPALAITALEMNEFGKDYARQVIKNAKALAKGLYENGFNVLCPELGFTESHQIILNAKNLGGGKKVAEKLEECNIICNKMALPIDSPEDATKNPSGIRIGVQELTRWGMKEKEMEKIAEFFKRILINGENVSAEVVELKKEFMEIQYCFKN